MENKDIYNEDLEQEKLFKVSELARQVGLTPAELKEKLVRIGAPITSTSSKVTKKYETLILSGKLDEKAKALAKPATGTANKETTLFRSATSTAASAAAASASSDTAEAKPAAAEVPKAKPKRRFKILDDGTTILIKDEEAPSADAAPAVPDKPETTLEEEEALELAKKAQEYEAAVPNRTAPRNAADASRRHKKAPASGANGPGGKRRKRNKRDEAAEKIESQVIRPLDQMTDEQKEAKKTEINICVLDRETITIRDLAPKLGVTLGDLMVQFLKLGMAVTVNQEIDVATVEKVAERFGILVEAQVQKQTRETIEKELQPDNVPDRPEDMVVRAPVITIMGHVDHGKTKLLDTIRKTNVMGGEAGGITQHIGAYQVTVHNRKLTFLDTPGHEAFTTLRARGAQVTDIVILLVAADDGIMPQTIEAIDHAKAAKVPIVVAINKIDKPEANVERVKQQLSEHGLLPEDWGGETVVCPVSAAKGTGVEQLLELLITIADMQDLKANIKKLANGVIIETKLDPKRGPVATVLIRNGILKVGDPFYVGAAFGKVRAIYNDQGVAIKVAEPSMPVEILGMNAVPQAGAIFQKTDDEKTARLAAESRAEIEKDQKAASKQLSLEKISEKVASGEQAEMNLIVKADVRGSIEALQHSLLKLQLEKVTLGIVHAATGDVNESDVMLAKASSAIVIAFNVNTPAQIQKMADEEKVSIRTYNIIYKAIDEVAAAMEGLLQVEMEEVATGHALVRTIFKSSKQGIIAGCFVAEGFIRRDCIIKVLRGKSELFKGKIDSLKRFKDDAKEVKQNFECGITLIGFEDFKEGDVLASFELKPKERKKVTVASAKA